jgi:hypothetical protein
MMLYRVFTVILILGFAPISFAQNHPSKIIITTVDVDGDFATLNSDQQQQILSQLVESAEDASEGSDEQHSSRNQVLAFFENWIKKANLPKIFLGMYRWVNVNAAHYPTTAADIGTLLLVSHTIEMSSGPTAVSIASSYGAPPSVLWALGLAGGVISVPGLDPLCIFLGGMYIRSPDFRNRVTKTRLFLIKAISMLGVDRLANWLIQKQSRVDFIINSLKSNPGKFSYLVPTEQSMAFEFRNNDGIVFARVELDTDQKTKKDFVKQFQINQDAAATINASEFSKMLGLFNMNVSLALSQAYRYYKKGIHNDLKKHYHVADIKIDPHNNQLQYDFLSSSLILTDERSWSAAARSYFTCAEITDPSLRD